MIPARNRNPRDKGRVDAMAALYRSGKTLEQIGGEYGITRERVRQLISWKGVTRLDGGQAMRTFLSVRDKQESNRSDSERRERACLRKWGLTLDEYRDHVSEWGNTAQRRTPLRRFIMQRRNAARRQILWRITFKDWWRIWEDSGHWHECGRGTGYCMARYGDSGGYEPGNVYICTVGQNFSDSYLVHPWSERFANSANHRRGMRSKGYHRVPPITHISKPFCVTFSHNGVKHYGGYFATEVEAAAKVAALLGKATA